MYASFTLEQIWHGKYFSSVTPAILALLASTIHHFLSKSGTVNIDIDVHCQVGLPVVLDVDVHYGKRINFYLN